MLTTLIRQSLRHRLLLLTLLALLAFYSIHALRGAALDAIPDVADPQIVVQVQWPRSPEQLDQRVTTPLVRTLLGLEGVRSVRASSHLGYSFIYVILERAGERQALRRQVQDQLNALRPRLPADVTLALGPDAGSMGWIYQYALVDRSAALDLRQLRLLNEGRLKPALERVDGIAEVATVGGLTRQLELKIYPPLLERNGVSLTQLTAALHSALDEVGGRAIELSSRDYQLQAHFDHNDLDQLERLLVGHRSDGQPVLLRDVGYLQVDYDLRRSIADLDGEGEVVGAIVVMEQGRNVLAVTAALDDALARLRPQLPPGVEIVTTYDRAELIWQTLKNFVTALVWELVVVIALIALVLRNRRAALAPLLIIVLGSLYTLLGLALMGETINLLSLAGLAIAIGVMADATIVIVENCAAELARQPGLDATGRQRLVIDSTARMMRPLLFSLLIILLSFLPVFFFGEREGRLFDPLAFSKTFAMAFSTLLTLLLMPILVVWAFRSHAVTAVARPGVWVARYRSLLGWALRRRYWVVGVAALMMVAALFQLGRFESAYMPALEEGALLYMPTTIPGLPMREAAWVLQAMDRKLKAFPEVERVFGKLGRADSATDPAPVTMVETTILLKPPSQWRAGMTREALVAQMDAEMQIIGYVNTWTQPIAARVMMQSSGIQTAVGLKIRGPEIGQIDALAREAEGILATLPGTASVLAERIAGGDFIDVQLDAARLAQHGVTLEEAMLTVRHGLGGAAVLALAQDGGTTVPLSVRYSPEYIDTLAKVEQLPVLGVQGQAVALADIAEVRVRQRAEMVRNDDGERAGYLYIDLAGVTPTDYVPQARHHLARHLSLPPGYSLEWSGSYRYAEEARAQLRWIVPLTLLLIFALLMLAFRSLAQSLMILLAAPFALVGAVVLQGVMGYATTTAVVVGYLAVLAIAIQTGILMVEFIRRALAQGAPGYQEAVIQGSIARLRPKLMTVATTIAGLLPILLISGSGMEITLPIAAPIVGGLLSSTLYVLLVIPCLFLIGRDVRGCCGRGYHPTLMWGWIKRLLKPGSGGTIHR